MTKINEIATEEAQDAWVEEVGLTDAQIDDFEAKGISLLGTEMEDGSFVTAKVYHTFDKKLSVDQIATINKAILDGGIDGFTATESGYSFLYFGESNPEKYAEWYNNIDNILKNTTNGWTNNYRSEEDNVKTWLHTADRQGESGNATEDVWQNRSRTYNDGNRNLQERFEKGEGFGNNRRNDTGDNGQQGSEQNGSGSNPQQSLLEEENHSAETQKFFNGVQSGKFRPQNELKFSKPLTARTIRQVYKDDRPMRSNRVIQYHSIGKEL